MVWVQKADLTQQKSVSDPGHNFKRWGNVLRFEVKQGDRTSFDADKERSELITDNIVHGTAWWVSYDFMIAPHAALTDWCVLGQIHTGDDGLNPWLAIEYNGTSILAGVMSNQSGSYVQTNYGTTAITKGRWYRMLWQIKEGWNSTGSILQWWIDGAQILNLSGIPMGHSSDVGNPQPPYHKFGIYRATQPPDLAVYYANMEWGTGSLLSRATNSSRPIIGCSL